MTIEDQPPPTPNATRAIWDLVIADMRERDAIGRARYGTPLQAGNGRDALVDAYQEALDLVAYLRQAIEERDPKAGDWKPCMDQSCPTAHTAHEHDSRGWYRGPEAKPFA
jgi:hypothetical protein